MRNLLALIGQEDTVKRLPDAIQFNVKVSISYRGTKDTAKDTLPLEQIVSNSPEGGFSIDAENGSKSAKKDEIRLSEKVEVAVDSDGDPINFSIQAAMQQVYNDFIERKTITP